MSEWKTNYLDINGAKLHYYRTGGDKPSIILSHGITDNGLCWTPITRQLEEYYDVIMVDARGHGLSDSLPDVLTSDTLANDLVVLIEELNLEKPILLGHSMGAQISARTAVIRPDLVSKLILEDPPAWGRKSRIPAFVLKRIMKTMMKRMLIKRLKGRTYEEIQAICKKENPKWSEDEIQPWASSKIQLFQQNPEQLFDAIFNSSSTDWYELVKDIQCPVLLIVSENGMTKKNIAQMLTEETWKNSQYVEIQNAGHNIRRENLEDFMTAINSFLKNE
ncbi:MAG: alpha/beta fold hydrolase [Candidatus Kariarchaeaceae archaeon]|jgi:pimeloyl-ACP methyl ester carboxylesterase